MAAGSIGNIGWQKTTVIMMALPMVMLIALAMETNNGNGNGENCQCLEMNKFNFKDAITWFNVQDAIT